MYSRKYSTPRPAVCNVLVVLSACRGRRHFSKPVQFRDNSLIY